MSENQTKREKRLKPNDHLALKLRVALGPWDHEREEARTQGVEQSRLEGWVKGKAEEELYAKLNSAKGGKRGYVADTDADKLKRVRDAKKKIADANDGNATDIAALRAAHTEKSIVGEKDAKGCLREGDALDRALNKWFDAAQHREMYAESDARWLRGLRRLLGKPGAKPK